MSISIVAAYPWAKAVALAKGQPSGVVVCTDTRLTVGDRPGTPIYSKQRLQSPNIVVAFTSSHVQTTELALQRAHGSRSVKAIGESLKKQHASFGGFTELIAVVWRSDLVPRVLELMPPDYRPVSRSGVIGIGDRPALEWFRQFGVEDPEKREGQGTPSQDFVDSVEKHFGWRWTPPPFTLHEAGALTTATLASAIEHAGGPTVSLPVQCWIIQGGTVEVLPVMRTADLKQWTELTAKQRTLKKLPPSPRRIGEVQRAARRAVQLFD